MPEETEETILPESEVRALFVKRNEPEWVGVPGQPGSRVAFQPMSPFDKRKFLSEGQTIRISGGKAETVGDMRIDQAAKDERLLLASVVAWELAVPERNADGETVSTTNNSPAKPDVRRNVLSDWFRGNMDNTFADWLIAQCERVNGLTVVQQGN